MYPMELLLFLSQMDNGEYIRVPWPSLCNIIRSEIQSVRALHTVLL